MISISRIKTKDSMKSLSEKPVKVISTEQNFSWSSGRESCLKFDSLYWLEIVSSALREDFFSGSCIPSPPTMYSFLLALHVEHRHACSHIEKDCRWFSWHVAYYSFPESNRWNLHIGFTAFCCCPLLLVHLNYQTISTLNYYNWNWSWKITLNMQLHGQLGS